MKSRFVSLSLAAAAAIAAAMAAAPAHAATIAWGTATDVAGPSDVSTQGTLLYAYTLGATANNTVNDVTFTDAAAPSSGNTLDFGTSGADGSLVNTASGGKLSGYVGFSSPTSITDTNYRTLLGDGVYQNPNTTSDMTLTLGSLTVGNEYQVQLWVNDSRVGSVATRSLTVSPSGSTGDSITLKYQTTASTTTTQYGGQYAIGTFTADAGSEVLTVLVQPEKENESRCLRDYGLHTIAFD
ncbi:MAG: hypothetical protein ACP5O1_12810, partial [Phycisphaerae bacterium]